MRRVLFVILLIAAAFGGGAMVNGPALKWTQSQLLDYMGLKDGGEIASIDLPPTPMSEPLNSSASLKPTTGSTIPGEAKNTSGLKNTDANAMKTSLGATSPSQGSSPSGLSKSAPDRLAADHAANPRGAPSASGSPDSTEARPAPLDPSVGSALLARMTSNPTPSEGKEAARALALEAAPSLSPPATASSSRLPALSHSGSQEAGGSAGEDTQWGSLRHTMQVVGVTQYTITGSPSGRVKIVCSIPMAGRQAVSQSFEADGNNEFEAARTAIRRITLWQATHDRAP